MRRTRPRSESREEQPTRRAGARLVVEPEVDLPVEQPGIRLRRGPEPAQHGVEKPRAGFRVAGTQIEETEPELIQPAVGEERVAAQPAVVGRRPRDRVATDQVADPLGPRRHADIGLLTQCARSGQRDDAEGVGRRVLDQQVGPGIAVKVAGCPDAVPRSADYPNRGKRLLVAQEKHAEVAGLPVAQDQVRTLVVIQVEGSEDAPVNAGRQQGLAGVGHKRAGFRRHPQIMGGGRGALHFPDSDLARAGVAPDDVLAAVAVEIGKGQRTPVRIQREFEYR